MAKAIYHDVTNNAGTGFKDVVKDIEMYIGMPCTFGYGSDCYPAHIERISASGKTVWIKEAIAVPDEDNGYDYFSNQVYIISPSEDGKVIKVSKRKNGQWKLSGTESTVFFGSARKYHDPHF